MANGYRVINFNGTVTEDELFDDNGQIKSELIPGGGVQTTSIECTNAANTPYGVTWDDGGTTITGTLVASESTQNAVYFVKNGDSYDEYMTFSDNGSYYWKKIGSTSTSSVNGLNYVIVR